MEVCDWSDWLWFEGVQIWNLDEISWKNAYIIADIGMVLSEWERMHAASISFRLFKLWRNQYSDEAKDYSVKSSKACIVESLLKPPSTEIARHNDILLYGEYLFVTHLAAIRWTFSIFSVFFCVRAQDRRSILNVWSYQIIIRSYARVCISSFFFVLMFLFTKPNIKFYLL